MKDSLHSRLVLQSLRWTRTERGDGPIWRPPARRLPDTSPLPSPPRHPWSQHRLRGSSIRARSAADQLSRSTPASAASLSGPSDRPVDGGTRHHDGQRSSEERSTSSLDVDLFNLEYLPRPVCSDQHGAPVEDPLMTVHGNHPIPRFRPIRTLRAGRRREPLEHGSQPAHRRLASTVRGSLVLDTHRARDG